MQTLSIPDEIRNDAILAPQLRNKREHLQPQVNELKPFADQSAFSVRFEWGEVGLDSIGPGANVIVIVDVLSFSTSIEIATCRGAQVFPYRWRDGRAARYAEERRAILADENRQTERYSLSPTSLSRILPGTRLVLPSPNGAALSLRAKGISRTVAACLRNAAAVAAYCESSGGSVAVVACGERWADGSLRPAWEDLMGAGAVIANLAGTLSPEARMARDAFNSAKSDLRELLAGCSSGRELTERGFATDVELAADNGVSQCVPMLEGDVFVDRGANS